jgi:diphosphomevalonate decarboxylase
MGLHSVTVRAPINIALIKYWGKRDEALVLPMNNSISITLSSQVIGTTTKVSMDGSFKETTLSINGNPAIVKDKDDKDTKRVWECILMARKLALDLKACPVEMLEWNLKIESWNDVPTAAGLASSASGYAALTYALMLLYGLIERNDPDLDKIAKLSCIARVGSGSACRSLMGGFVEWEAGSDEKGSDSIIRSLPISSRNGSWDPKDMHVLILTYLPNTGESLKIPRKHISSTVGMSTTVETSTLYPHRINDVLPERIQKFKKAINDGDFNNIAQITMQDAMQFHAVCMDTWPPIIYLNDFSTWIIKLIHFYNNESSNDAYKLAYTFDAGPHPVILCSDQKSMLEFTSLFQYLTKQNGDHSISFLGWDQELLLDLPRLQDTQAPKMPNSIYSPSDITCYHCTIGNGPVCLDMTEN